MKTSISSHGLSARLAFLAVLALDSVCLAASGPVVFTHGVASGDIRPRRAQLSTKTCPTVSRCAYFADKRALTSTMESGVHA